MDFCRKQQKTLISFEKFKIKSKKYILQLMHKHKAFAMAGRSKLAGRYNVSGLELVTRIKNSREKNLNI
jgi:hypothetical protein